MSGEFREALRSAVSGGLSPREAYDQACQSRRKADLVEHFRPVGEDEARHLLRQASRSIENRVFSGRRLQARDVPVERVDVRSLLGSATFIGAGGKLVTWESATVEDHEARADSQERLAVEVAKDADRHRRAAKLIREVEGETLDDVEDWSALADEEE